MQIFHPLKTISPEPQLLVWLRTWGSKFTLMLVLDLKYLLNASVDGDCNYVKLFPKVSTEYLKQLID